MSTSNATESYGPFTYVCKKNGQSVTIASIDGLPFASRQYFMLKGANEYFDNYHASVSHPNATRNGKPAQSAFKGTESAFKAEITRLVTEAHTRLVAGDVPGHRVVVVTPAQEAVISHGLESASKSDIAELLALGLAAKAEANRKAKKVA